MSELQIDTHRIGSAGTGVSDVGTSLAREIATMHDLLGQIRGGWQSSEAAPRFAAAMEGHLAEAAAQAILSMSSATDAVRTSALACVAVMAVQRGDVDAARRHYAALQLARGTIIYMGMAADRLLGRLAEVIGDHRAANEHFEDALNFCRSRGCLPELALTCYDFASL